MGLMGEKRKRQREKKSKPSESEPAKKTVKVDPIPAHIKEVDVGAKKEIAKHIKKQEKRLIVVLESANLETVKVWFDSFLIRSLSILFIKILST